VDHIKLAKTIARGYKNKQNILFEKFGFVPFLCKLKFISLFFLSVSAFLYFKIEWNSQIDQYNLDFVFVPARWGRKIRGIHSKPPSFQTFPLPFGKSQKRLFTIALGKKSLPPSFLKIRPKGGRFRVNSPDTCWRVKYL